MRFLGYTLGDPSTPMTPPGPEDFTEMGKFIEEATKAGVLLATGGVAPAREATKVDLLRREDSPSWTGRSPRPRS